MFSDETKVVLGEDRKFKIIAHGYSQRERAARYNIGYVLKLYNYKWCRDSYTSQWKYEFQYLD